MNFASHYISLFFALLSAIFLVLSFTRGSHPAKKTWLRIGIIFAMVALMIFAMRPR